MLFKRFGRVVPLGKIKVRCEREERARKVDRRISVKSRIMRFKGRHWKATQQPDAEISLRPSKEERRLWKIFRDLESIVKDREARRKENRAYLDRLMKYGLKKR